MTGQIFNLTFEPVSGVCCAHHLFRPKINLSQNTFIKLYVRGLGLFVDFKNMGTIFWSSWPFEKMPLLYFDYVKTADFGSEKKILV